MGHHQTQNHKWKGETTPNFHACGGGGVHPASIPLSQPPIPPALVQVSQAPPPRWGLGACVAGGGVTRGDAPPPFVPRVGGGDHVKGSQKGQPTWEWPQWTPSPALGCQDTRGQGPALTHPRKDSSPGTDGGGGAHAQRWGASAKCRGEKRPPTSKRAQRQKRESRNWMAERAETQSFAGSGLPGQARLFLESR